MANFKPLLGLIANISYIDLNIVYLKPGALTSHDVLSRPWFLPLIIFQTIWFLICFRVNLVLSILFQFSILGDPGWKLWKTIWVVLFFWSACIYIFEFPRLQTLKSDKLKTRKNLERSISKNLRTQRYFKHSCSNELIFFIYYIIKFRLPTKFKIAVIPWLHRKLRRNVSNFYFLLTTLYLCRVPSKNFTVYLMCRNFSHRPEVQRS